MTYMDDLISRKSLLEKTHMADVLHAIKGITKSVEVVLADDVEVAPSAFEGMTNGEAIISLYPNLKYTIRNGRVVTTIGVASSFDLEWWNAPYKGVSE